MHRFFTTSSLSSKLRIPQGDLFHQITHVFRAKKGERIIFFVSGGVDIVYEVIEIKRNEILLEKKEELERAVSKNILDLHIFQAYPNKISTMEIIVQKLVEIGVKKLTFFPGEHSQIRDLSEQKQARLSSISREALEQSGGNEPLDIFYSQKNISEILLELTPTRHIFAHQAGHCNIEKLIKKNNQVALWIGPEGGWSPGENAFLQKNDASLWSFNGNILRSETAAIVGAGILLYNQHGA